ncbi:MAG: hypothetical protein R3F11_03150 [Verrucomicrobiales bacterium]
MLDNFVLSPGDRIFVDVGAYFSAVALQIDAEQDGVEIIGAETGVTSLTFGGQYGVNIDGASGFALRHLRLFGGTDAVVRVSPTSADTVLDSLGITADEYIGILIESGAVRTTVTDSGIGARQGIVANTASVVLTGNNLGSVGQSTNRNIGSWGIRVDAPDEIGAVVNNNTASGFDRAPDFASSQISRSAGHGISIRVAGGVADGNTVSGNAVGLYLEATGEYGALTSSGTTATGNGTAGVEVWGGVLASNITAQFNGAGVRGFAGFTGEIADSESFDNDVGFLMHGGTVRDSVAYGNGVGVQLAYQMLFGDFDGTTKEVRVAGNTIYNNGVGISESRGEIFGFTFVTIAKIIDEDPSSIIENNLIYANSLAGITSNNAILGGEGSAMRIANNTIVQYAGAVIQLGNVSQNVELVNNILVADGASVAILVIEDTAQRGFRSDYNLYHAPQGADLIDVQRVFDTLEEWASETGNDLHSLVADPLFVDPDGADNILGGAGAADDDFRLQSTAGSFHAGAWSADAADSPAIDAGEPGIALEEAEGLTEIDPLYAQHGDRANLGAYGNTGFASRSAASGIHLLSPAPIAKVLGGRDYAIVWQSFGALSGNVDIEISLDGGGVWQPVAAGVADTGSFAWTASRHALHQRSGPRHGFGDRIDLGGLERLHDRRADQHDLRQRHEFGGRHGGDRARKPRQLRRDARRPAAIARGGAEPLSRHPRRRRHDLCRS